MYASIRIYRSDPSMMDELLRIADEEFAPQIEDLPGFCEYQMIDGGDGTLVTVSCFEEREQCERSVEMAADFVASRLAEYDIERLGVHSGAIRVSMAKEAMLQPAHV